MRVRLSWLAAAVLLLGYFLVLPEEGSAATKRTTGSLSLNFAKIEFGVIQVDDPAPPPPHAIANITFGVPEGRVGPAGSGGPVLPTIPDLGVLDVDSLGVAHAASQDVYLTAPPASLPPLSSYHLSMDFTLPGSSLRGLAGAMHVTHDPADPSTLDRSYWESNVAVAMPGTVDYLYDFIVEANPDQPGLSLKSVQTAQAPMFSPIASSFFDVFVELNYDSSSPIDTSKPLLWLTTSAVPEPASVSLVLMCSAMVMRRRK